MTFKIIIPMIVCKPYLLLMITFPLPVQHQRRALALLKALLIMRLASSSDTCLILTELHCLLPFATLVNGM